MVKVFKKIAIYFCDVLESAPLTASQLLIIKARLIKYWPDLEQWRPEPKSARLIREIVCRCKQKLRPPPHSDIR